MDNQYSSPQIVFPNVPDNFCPEGNWTDVLQAFIDEVLANGTVNIANLADVTPQTIAEINARLTLVESELSQITSVIAYNGTATGFVAGTDSQVTITFTDPLPSTSYAISLTPVMPASGIGTNDPIIGILTGTKTVNGFIISLQNNGTSPNNIIDVEWGVIYQ